MVKYPPLGNVKMRTPVAEFPYIFYFKNSLELFQMSTDILNKDNI